MTIKELAKMSNVSISTVSKILNGKDDSISSETREKVLQLAREYHYTPYNNSAGGSRFLVGAVVKDSREGQKLLAGMNRAARAHGYGVVCCVYGDGEESEKKAVATLCAQAVTAVLWQRDTLRSMEYLPYFEEKEIVVYFCDFLPESDAASQFTLDYGRYGYEAARYLLGCRHRRIGCCTAGEDERKTRFIRGFERCLYDSGMESRPDFIVDWNQIRGLSDLTLYDITALVCMDEEIAADVYRKAAESGYRIPKDLSIIALSADKSGQNMYPQLTRVYLPLEELGEYACTQAIAAMEKTPAEVWKERMEVLGGGSTVDVPLQAAGKIVVVGSINMDSIISVRQFPEAGQTSVAFGLHSYAGGKGFNQAVGAAKLGAEVVLIGKLGQDYEAKVLRDEMAGYGLKMDGISESAAGGTGKAFVTVQKDGESNIIVYAGANRYLSREDIRDCLPLFAGASFCLLQTEIPVETVEYAAHEARERGIRTILKPAAVDGLGDSLLEKIDILVPNHKELLKLCPGNGTMEEKAGYFLRKGVREVIVTLDEHGCLYVSPTRALYFQAADFKAVDTTGAADAFISALAVYLTEGLPMERAIQFATCAAGFSTTRNGVPSSMADRDTMDEYADRIDGMILYRTGEMF